MDIVSYLFLLNKTQCKGMADFFFDVAKGALLAGLGFSVVTPTLLILRLTFFFNGVVFAGGCLYFALWFLRGVDN